MCLTLLILLMYDISSIPGFSDPFSSLSHLLGAVGFLLLAIPMLRLGWGNVPRFIALGVFCFACVFLLSMSSVYHLLQPNGLARTIFQRLDHSAIFILIVGTMTPIHEILFKGFMRGGWLILIWLIAITALTLKGVFFDTLPEWLGLVMYLSLGWLGIVSCGIIWYRSDLSSVKLLILGGLAYTIGAVMEFFQVPVIVNGILGPHELFHLAVLVGLSLHWKFVYNIALESPIHQVIRRVWWQMRACNMVLMEWTHPSLTR